jgi:hypothetical protein
MLIRIGDEKREMIDQHLTVLKNKFLDLLRGNDEEGQTEALGVLRDVIENMPHKSVIYACLIAMMAMEEPEKTEIVFSRIMAGCLSESFAAKQDGFKSKNLFRWMGYLAELRVLSATTLVQFLNELPANSPGVQQDLVFHCILTSISTENVPSISKEENPNGV